MKRAPKELAAERDNLDAILADLQSEISIAEKRRERLEEESTKTTGCDCLSLVITCKGHSQRCE